MARSAGLISIKYKLDSDNPELVGSQHYTGEISFHAIISEDHTSTAEVTKFPVQSGFEVSNHAVRKNKKIVLEGIVTNAILPGQVDFNASSNSKLIYRTLKQLLEFRTPCYVYTNLGQYRPVVFTSFKTKQGVGMMDSMLFTLLGEELIVATSTNRSGPRELSFKIVPEVEWQALRDTLQCQGIEVNEGDTLSTATIKDNDSFSISNAVGAVTTFVSEGVDWFQSNTLQSHVTDYDVFGTAAAVDEFNMFGLAKEPEEGFDALTCMKDAVGSAVSDAASDYVETALGPLEESLYGVKTDIINIGGDAVAPLLNDGLDCIVALAADNILDKELDECGQPIPRGQGDLPSANDIIGGISDAGVTGTQQLVKIGRGALG